MKYLIILFLFLSYNSWAQSVTIDPNTATNGSAIIKAQSTSAGTLIPNVTTAQRNVIASPQKGLLVFDTDTGTFWFHNGTDWVQLVSSTSNWTPYNSNTELSSNNYARFNLGGGTNTTALASGVGTEGTLKINSPSPITASKYLSLDGNSIQARRINVFTDFKTENNLLLNPFGGNVGIGLSSPNAPLQFASTSGINRKIVLYEEFNNNHQFYGFGINDGLLRYQTTGGGDHVFYSATSASSSKELMRVKYDGNLKVSEGIYSNQTGNLNMVPLGVAEFNVTETNDGFTTNSTFSNLSGNLILSSTSSSTISVNDELVSTFSLNPAITSNYSKIIGMCNLSWKSEAAFSGTYPQLENFWSATNSLEFKVGIIVDSFSLLNSGFLSGTVIFYGIK
jgi:hypothetical protein